MNRSNNFIVSSILGVLYWLYFAPTVCSAQQSSIEGIINGIGNNPIQFWYGKEGKRQVDTVYAVKDHFKYFPKFTDDSTLKIYIKSPFLSTIWLEPGKITVSGSFENPARLRITGGPENDLQHSYNSQIDWPYQDLLAGKPDSVKLRLNEEKNNKTLIFLEQHPSHRLAADLLYWQSQFNENKIEDYERLRKQFEPKVLGSKQGIKLSERLKTIQKQPMPGKQAPSFVILDSSGKPVSLTDFNGKYVLLDFWGHWCAPCIRALPSIKALHENYLGKLQIIGIAAEHPDDREKWLKIIKDSNLNWLQLSEFQFDKGKVVNDYSISAFPTYFLLDKSGIIISKATSIAEIQKAVASISDLN
jgi:thiol-disulfide isomerase/thioredoxin